MAKALLTEALRVELLKSDDFRNLVEERVYPDKLPQGGKLPALKYETLADRRERKLSEASGLRRARVQFDAYAATRAEADRVADLVEEVIDGLSGTIGDELAAVFVHDATQDTRYTRAEPQRPPDDLPLYRTVVDFEVNYRHDASTITG